MTLARTRFVLSLFSVLYLWTLAGGLLGSLRIREGGPFGTALVAWSRAAQSVATALDQRINWQMYANFEKMNIIRFYVDVEFESGPPFQWSSEYPQEIGLYRTSDQVGLFFYMFDLAYPPKGRSMEQRRRDFARYFARLKHTHQQPVRLVRLRSAYFQMPVLGREGRTDVPLEATTLGEFSFAREEMW